MRDPLKCTKVKEEVAVDEQIKTFEVTEKQVIVHCSLHSPNGTYVRIWKSTYLKTESGQHCPLVSWKGITLAPQWMPSSDEYTRFTLIFTGLPSDCKVFSLIEDIPEDHGFVKHGIQRNESDIYQIAL